MTCVSKIFLALGLLAALTAPPTLAVVPLPPTVPSGVSPQWTPVPGSPEVEFAPNLKVDLFRYNGRYYYWVAGAWRVGQNPTGPWQRLEEAPPALRRLDPGLFKSIHKPATPKPQPGSE
jgi:hypothetical protein